MALKIINLDTPSLGDRSYIAHDGKMAVVIDPQRDIDRITAILAAEGVGPGARNAGRRSLLVARPAKQSPTW
ncbi:MAG: hypothetical protein O2896_03195 [Actinomycetota bacterium]|nr:hypothetical protein [Actinomycetota bacterium]